MSEEEATVEAGWHSKGDLLVGGLPGKYAWDGFIDEVRLWDEAIPEEQVIQQMNDVCIGVGNSPVPHLIGQWTFNEGAGEMVIDSSGNRNHGSYEKYAGGVEMRRVQSRRPKIVKMLSASEQIVDANFLRFCKWKKEFEQKNGRVPNKADIMLSGEEILNLARRLGEFQG